MHDGVTPGGFETGRADLENVSIIPNQAARTAAEAGQYLALNAAKTGFELRSRPFLHSTGDLTVTKANNNAIVVMEPGTAGSWRNGTVTLPRIGTANSGVWSGFTVTVVLHVANNPNTVTIRPYSGDKIGRATDGTVVLRSLNESVTLVADGGSNWVMYKNGGGGGTSLPADAAGFLKNDGSGTLSWAGVVPVSVYRYVGDTDHTVTADEDGKFIAVQSSGQAQTITLPAGSAIRDGWEVTIQKANNDNNYVRVQASGSDGIASSNDFIINPASGSDYVDLLWEAETITMINFGSLWFVKHFSFDDFKRLTRWIEVGVHDTTYTIPNDHKRIYGAHLSTDQTFTLPDPSNLPDDWEIIIHNRDAADREITVNGSVNIFVDNSAARTFKVGLDADSVRIFKYGQHNEFIVERNHSNLIRQIGTGGTGATTAAAALVNLGASGYNYVETGTNNYNIASSQNGVWIGVTGSTNKTINLPSLTSRNFRCVIQKIGSGDLIVQAPSGHTIDINGGSARTYTLTEDDQVIVLQNITNTRWRAFSVGATIAVADGGTGATNALEARANLDAAHYGGYAAIHGNLAVNRNEDDNKTLAINSTTEDRTVTMPTGTAPGWKTHIIKDQNDTNRVRVQVPTGDVLVAVSHDPRLVDAVQDYIDLEHANDQVTMVSAGNGTHWFAMNIRLKRFENLVTTRNTASLSSTTTNLQTAWVNNAYAINPASSGRTINAASSTSNGIGKDGDTVALSSSSTISFNVTAYDFGRNSTRSESITRDDMLHLKKLSGRWYFWNEIE